MISAAWTAVVYQIKLPIQARATRRYFCAPCLERSRRTGPPYASVLPATMVAVELQELLDERRLVGLHGIRRLLAPERAALAIDASDLSDAAVAIEAACQRWGGGCFPLLPAADSDPVLSERWQNYLDECLVDHIWYRHLPKDAISYRGSTSRLVEWQLGEFVLAVMDSASPQRDRWRQVVVAAPPQDSDWFIAYATALGLWPDTPDPVLLERNQIVEDLKWDQVVPTRFELVDEPSAADLLRRLREPGSTTPVRMSLALLGLFRAPRSASIHAPAVLPRENEAALHCGPNLIVVYEPGNVEDLALLWDLRLSNGLPDGLPLGVPRSADLASVLRQWNDEFAFQMWTLGQDRGAITSASVDLEELEPLATEDGPVSWAVVAPEQVLRDSDRPARTSVDVATFNNGEATVSGWDAADRDSLGSRRTDSRRFGAVVRFTLLDRRLPPSRSLEPEYSIEPGFRGGGFEAPNRRSNSLSPVRWPAGWTVVDALARDRGLHAQPSAAGLAAAALLRRIGSMAGLGALLTPALVELLYRLGERAGMTWFRARLREIGAALHEADQERLEAVINSLHFSASAEEQHETTFSQLVSLLGRDAAGAWLGWAEEQELLIRGARITCDRCGARSWRALEELSPHPVCRGCGRLIGSPFPPGQLPFAFRAGEAVLQTMQHDALVQLLAMRWFCDLWRPSHGPAALFGAYPGVEFYEPGRANPIGETDLLLVGADGQLAIGECKRRGAGLAQDDIEKLERLAERLKVPWTFLATLDRASSCPEIWTESLRELPAEPRFALTAEHLFESDVFWPAGANILAWRDEADGVHEERHTQFTAHLTGWLGWLGGKRTMEEEMMRERGEQLGQDDAPEAAG